MKETITKQQYLIFLGVMMAIKINYLKFREYETMLVGLLGEENEDHVADEIYGTEGFDMDIVLEKCNLEIGDERIN